MRRTRIDGDSWESFEVPIGEQQEKYLVRVVIAGAIVREAYVTQPTWSYSSAMQAADAFSGGELLMVAQVSDRFGPGPFSEIHL